MKTNLVRLMAIATLATAMSFGAEKEMKNTSATTAGKPEAAQQKQQQKTGKKTRKEKKQKDASQQNNDGIENLGIWG